MREKPGNLQNHCKSKAFEKLTEKAREKKIESKTPSVDFPAD